MGDRFHQTKLMHNMTFGGELDMVQDPMSETYFRQTKTFNKTEPNMASTAMPVVSKSKLREDENWIDTGPRFSPANGPKGSLTQEDTSCQPRADPEKRGQSEMFGRSNTASPVNYSYRYTVTSWVDNSPNLAGDLDMRTDSSKQTSRTDGIMKKPFVSRLPVLPSKHHRSLEKFSVKDYVPKRHKAKIVVWADLTVDAVDRLNESLNADHIKQVLADIFVLDNYKDSLKMGIVMDLYYHTLQFARTQGFSPEKTSAFFSIIKKVFEVCIETPFGNLDHTFEYFKDLIHCHSVNRPPYSIELFSPDEVRKITEYTINTFFRHFKMYKYAFTPLVRLDLGIKYEGMPPTPPPTEDTIDAKTPGTGDDELRDSESKTEENDEEHQAAREELKNLVKNFLTAESKKIEGSVDQQVKVAVDALSAKIDQMTDAAPKAEGKGKKK